MENTDLHRKTQRTHRKTTVQSGITALLLALSLWLVPMQAGAGNALDFDGSDDLVNCGDIDALDNISKMTLEAWVRFSALGRLNSIICKRGDHYNKFQLSLGESSNTDDIRVQMGDGTLGYGYTSADIISTGTWYHLAMVFDGTQTGNADRLKLYVNGVQQSLAFSDTVPAVTA